MSLMTEQQFNAHKNEQLGTLRERKLNVRTQATMFHIDQEIKVAESGTYESYLKAKGATKKFITNPSKP